MTAIKKEMISKDEKLEKIKQWTEKRCWDKMAPYSIAHQIMDYWEELIACGEEA